MSSLNLGTLFVQLNAESKSFAKDIRSAAEVVEKFAKETKKLANDVAQVSGGLLAIGGAAVALAASVDGRTNQAFTRLQNSVKLVAVQVADILRPAVDALTRSFRSLADWIAGLDPGLKKQLATWAVWIAQLAVAAKVIGTVFGLIDGVAGALGALSGAIAAVGIVPLLEIAAVVGAIIALVVVLHRAWRKNWGDIQGVVAEVAEWMRNAFTKLAGFFRSFWNWQIDRVEAFANGLLNVASLIEEVTGKKIGDNGVAGLRAGFKGLFDDLRSGEFFSVAFDFGKKIAQEAADSIVEEVGIIAKEIKAALGINGGSSGGKARGFGPQKPIVSGAMRGLDPLRRNAISAGGEFLADLARIEKANKRIADARAAELRERLKIVSDLNRARTLAGAAASGDLTGLSDAEKKQVTADTGGAWSDLTKAQQNLGNFMERMGPALLQGLGKAGQSISNIIQGAMQGGPIGALVAVISEIVQTMASFQRLLADLSYVFERLGQMLEPLIGSIFDFVGDVLAVVVESLAPIFSSLKPLFDALKEPLAAITPILGLLAYLFAAIAPVVEVLAKVIGAVVSALKPLIQGLFYVVKGILLVVTGAVTGLAKALGTIWNAIVDAVAGLAEFVVNLVTAGLGGKAVGDSIRSAKGDLSTISAPMQALADATWDSELATTSATAATWDVARAQKDAAKTAQEVSEALTNVPTGYKVALARFNATDPNPGIDMSGGGGGGAIYVEQVVVTGVTDAETLATEVRKVSERTAAQKTGTPLGKGQSLQ